MKKQAMLWMVGIAVVTCAVAFGDVVTQPFSPTKDAGMPGHSSENNCNMGADNADRTIKDYQHTGAYAFDLGAVATWLTSNTPVDPTSLASITQAISDGYLKAEFSVCQVGTGYNGLSAQVRTIDCAVDWTQGNGTSNWDNFNWTSGTVAATWTNPNQVHPDQGAALGAGWGLAQNAGFTNAAYTLNSQTMTWGAVADSYATAELDAGILHSMLNDVNNRGLYIFAPWGGDSNNSSYFSEQGGTDRAPKLVLTYEEPEVAVIPEPAGLGLLGLLGLALLGRLKKRDY